MWIGLMYVGFVFYIVLLTVSLWVVGAFIWICFSQGWRKALKKTYLYLIVLFLIVLSLVLTISGFCWEKKGYLSDDDFKEIAFNNFEKKFSEKINREDFFKKSFVDREKIHGEYSFKNVQDVWLDRCLGFYIVEVSYVDTFPEEGSETNYYYMPINQCGEVFKSRKEKSYLKG